MRFPKANAKTNWLCKTSRIFSDLGPEGLAQLARDLESGAKQPRDAKEELALEIVAHYHGRGVAQQAAREFAQIFREHGLPEEIEEVKLAGSLLPNVMAAAGLAAGTSEARRLLKEGAVKLDGEKVTDVNLELSPGRTFLLQVGKRRFKKITLRADA
jgi:tyrosyl-tRNA synthetase